MDDIRSIPKPEKPSFEEFTNFIREWAALPDRKPVTPETLFESDLGITGDDGVELLEATERRFGVCLCSPEDEYGKTFNLGPDEFLFHGEGGPIGLIVSLFEGATVRRFTVGDLFDAVTHAPPSAGGPKSTRIVGLED